MFQSAVIGGAYGTGKEMTEFFLSLGPTGGALALALNTVIWSAVAIASFELARVFKAFDYRSLLRVLLGPFWVVFEALYLILLMLVLAVIAAAAGTILQETFGLPYLTGVIGSMALVGLLVFGGNEVIERVFTGWSTVLYLVYVIFFIWCLRAFGPAIQESFASGVIDGSWINGGLRYAGYNLGILPAAFIAIRHHRSRKDTVISGLLTGPIAMMPAVLFFVAIAGEYPAIVGAEVPVDYMLRLLGSQTFRVVYYVMLFGTLVETGAGMIHAVNERVARAMAERKREISSGMRVACATGLLVAGALISELGLTPLVAKGYGTITWGFVVVFVLPVLTRGVFLCWKKAREEA